MQMVLFSLVAILFVAGCGLIFVGLRRQPDRLPQGADNVLDAIVNGRLAPPPAPKSVDHTGEVRLVRRPPGRPHVTPTSRPDQRGPAPASAAPEPSSRDPRDVLAERESDDDLTLDERRFFADEPQLEKF